VAEEQEPADGGVIHIDLRGAQVMSDQDVEALVAKVGAAVATRIRPRGGDADGAPAASAPEAPKPLPPRGRELASFEYAGGGPLMQAPVVNGHKLTSVVSFTAGVDVDSLPVITLKLMPADMLKLMFDGVMVSVDDETREALVSLGWTPPEQ
jgi:hypothetical protein